MHQLEGSRRSSPKANIPDHHRCTGARVHLSKFDLVTKPPCARCAATREREIAVSHTIAECWGDSAFKAKHAHFVRRRMEALEKRKQAAKTTERRAALRLTITPESMQRQCLQVHKTWVFDHLATYEYVAATEISERAELAEEEQGRRPILP